MRCANKFSAIKTFQVQLFYCGGTLKKKNIPIYIRQQERTCSARYSLWKTEMFKLAKHATWKKNYGG